ncbi:MAG TPA: hypothetical protein VJ455_03960 [Ignavibacteria bacterium]|nr:hypothetical protein [Ignavibacteria bacterium]
MFRYIIYAIIIYIVYLAVKWAFRLGAASSGGKKESKNFKRRNNFKNIEEAEYKEVKKDNPDTD